MPIFDSKKVTVIFVLGGPGAGKYPSQQFQTFLLNAVKVKVHNVRDSSTISISLIYQVYFVLFFLVHQYFLELSL